MFLIGPSLGTIAYSEATTFECYSRERSGLKVEIRATSLAWPGENITITVKALATEANIHVRFITVNVSSLNEDLQESLLNSTTFLVDEPLGIGKSKEISYEVFVPNDTSPGSLYGQVEYSWFIKNDPGVTDLSAFRATYIQSKAYEELKEEYGALQDLFDDLKANKTSLELNYTALQEKYQQLLAGDISEHDSATGLMYLFLITTGIFAVTTILLLVRRPKRTTW